MLVLPLPFCNSSSELHPEIRAEEKMRLLAAFRAAFSSLMHSHLPRLYGPIERELRFCMSMCIDKHPQSVLGLLALDGEGVLFPSLRGIPQALFISSRE